MIFLLTFGRAHYMGVYDCKMHKTKCFERKVSDVVQPSLSVSVCDCLCLSVAIPFKYHISASSPGTNCPWESGLSVSLDCMIMHSATTQSVLAIGCNLNRAATRFSRITNFEKNVKLSIKNTQYLASY